jgi:exopolysaccharide biosynthesis polyprenyl glycosylphosphotransferase
MSTTGAAPAKVRVSVNVHLPPGPAPSNTLEIRRAPSSTGKRAAGGQRRFEVVVNILERAADFVAVVTGVVAAYAIYDSLHLGKHLQYPLHLLVSAAAFFAMLFVYLMDWDGGYQRGNSLLRIRETERILRVAMKAFLFVFPITFLAGQLFSRWLLTLGLLTLPVCLVAERQFLWHCVRWMHAKGYGVENVLIYGAGFTGHKVFSALARSPKLGLNPVAVVDDNRDLAGETIFEHSYRRERSVSVIPGPITKQTIADCGARQLIIAIPSLPHDRFNEVLAEAMAADARVAFVPRLSFSSEATTNCAEIDGLLISELGHLPNPPAYEITKRVFDFLSSIVLIALTLPLGVIIAVLVWRDSSGPVLFSQERIGRGGKPFRLYKFRSMYADAPKYALHPQAAEDPRITPVGRFLRRTSLDELPQLINVLRGEMSLVGPRPEMPFIAEQYNTHQRQRLDVIPGITGLWQLSADRAFLIHENIFYDLYYIRHRSFFMDVAILLHTIAFAMKGV